MSPKRTRGTRRIKVHGYGRNNQFSINGGKRGSSLRDIGLQKKTRGEIATMLCSRCKEREREKLRNETGARAQRDVEKETICVPLGRNNLERSLPYLNFYATSYSTNNSCHVPHV